MRHRTRSGATPASSRSSPRPRCAARSASWTAPCAAATRGAEVRVEVRSATPLRFPDGSPVRAASGVVAHDGGWLVLQDDSTYACLWRDGVGTPLRLLGPVRGLDVFDEASGTKALKPDLEACVTLPDGRTLVLGSGSTPARMRAVLLSSASILVSGLAPVLARGRGGAGRPRRPAQPRGRVRRRRVAAVVPARAARGGGAERERRRTARRAARRAHRGARRGVGVRGAPLRPRRRARDHRRRGAAGRDGAGERRRRGERVDVRRRAGHGLGARPPGRRGGRGPARGATGRRDGREGRGAGSRRVGAGGRRRRRSTPPYRPCCSSWTWTWLSSSPRRPGSSGCRGRCARSAAAGARAGTPSARTRSGRRSRRRRRS